MSVESRKAPRLSSTQPKGLTSLWWQPERLATGQTWEEKDLSHVVSRKKPGVSMT